MLTSCAERVSAAQRAGIQPDAIAVDPGIGFSKRTEHSLRALACLERLAAWGQPVVVGASRKRFIGEITGEANPSAPRIRERRRGGGGVRARRAGVARARRRRDPAGARRRCGDPRRRGRRVTETEAAAARCIRAGATLLEVVLVAYALYRVLLPLPRHAHAADPHGARHSPRRVRGRVGAQAADDHLPARLRVPVRGDRAAGRLRAGAAAALAHLGQARFARCSGRWRSARSPRRSRRRWSV